ncbi:hypothetical protein IM511_10705 [Erythrobacteraceae bacterium E2-1 Yellow Sea]|nr:hypothetical protein [Erythrobacteraceae bacterium E2-1 Yellow Sea]
MSNLSFALAALIPAMMGPLPQAEGDVLVVALCGGGAISIPLNDGDQQPAPAPCNFKACHGGDSCRKKFDRSQ